MAIYSLRLAAIGKSTQSQPFTAAAHVKYITRKQAVTHVLAARMPGTRRQAMAWLRKEERQDRKNARVIDKLVLALPKELSAAQQHALVRDFAERLTQGRASWLAAFHTAGKDENNPHCHLILRDRDVETKRRVMFLSAGKKEAAQRREKGEAAPTTLAAIREMWGRFANAALAAAGRSERIDHRSLVEQGVARRPQVHEGPNIRAMHRRGFRPASRDRVVRNNPLRRRGRAVARVVRYPEIDKGRTRIEYNAALRQERLGGGERVRERAVPPVGPQEVFSGGFGRGGPPPVVPLSLTQSVAVSGGGGGQEVGASSPPAVPARELSLTELLAREHGVAPVRPGGSGERDRGR